MTSGQWEAPTLVSFLSNHMNMNAVRPMISVTFQPMKCLRCRLNGQWEVTKCSIHQSDDVRWCSAWIRTARETVMSLVQCLQSPLELDNCDGTLAWCGQMTACHERSTQCWTDWTALHTSTSNLLSWQKELKQLKQRTTLFKDGQDSSKTSLACLLSMSQWNNGANGTEPIAISLVPVSGCIKANRSVMPTCLPANDMVTNQLWFIFPFATNAAVTCEIKLFQNYFGGLLQLTNIFQHVQCAEIILK